MVSEGTRAGRTPVTPKSVNQTDFGVGYNVLFAHGEALSELNKCMAITSKFMVRVL